MRVSPRRKATPDSRIRESGPGRVSVRVHNRDALRALVASCADEGLRTKVTVVTHLDVEVANAKPPHMGWLGSTGVRTQSVQAQWSGNGFTCAISFAEPVNLAVALAAVVRLCTPIPSGTNIPKIAWQLGALPESGQLAETLTTLIDLHSNSDSNLDSNSDSKSDSGSDKHLRFADVVIGESVAGESSDVGVTHASVFHLNQELSCVDPLVHRPLGRRSTLATPNLQPRTVTAAELNLPAHIDTPTVRALREFDVVTDSDQLSESHQAQLRACGLVLTNTQSLEMNELNAISIAGRSQVLRHRTAQPRIFGWPSVSVVLVTHRPEFLHRIIEMIAQQTYPNLELVLITHGFDIDDHIGSHVHELRFPAIHQELSSDLNLGETLITASALASGELITKVDDDDFYGPEHVWDLVVARMYSGAQVVGKALDHIYLAAKDQTVFRPTYAAEKYADFVAGGTILISLGDLRQVGGWRPVPKSVDRALLDRVLEHNGLIYRTHGRGYIYVRHGESMSNTSIVADEHFETKVQAVRPGLDTGILADYGVADLGKLS